MSLTITTLPPAPSRGDDDVTFSTKSDNLLGALAQFVAEANALIAQADIDAYNAVQSAASAANQATAAASAASTAIATTNIPRWVSGTTYAADVLVVSPITNLTYRRRSAGAGTTDPANDNANWAPTSTMQFNNVALATAYTAVAADKATVFRCTTTFTLSLSAASAVGNGYFIFVRNTGTGIITVTPNGAETINGLATLTLGYGKSALLVSNGSSFTAMLFAGDTVETIGADIVAAATIVLTATTGDTVHVTGSTPITGITMPVGAKRTLLINDGVTFTYGASLITPYNNDLAVPAGSIVHVVGDAAGVVRVTAASNLQRPYLHCRDEKAANTSGGTNAVGVNQRTLNTVVLNSITGASVTSSVVTLPAGTYYVRGSAPAYATTGLNRLNLYNNTDGVVTLVGQVESGATATTVNMATFEGKFTITATKAFIVRHQMATAVANGLGIAINDGNVEVYASLWVWKEA